MARKYDNEVVATDRVGGVTVSTVYRPYYGDYETCLFDDRNGTRSVNPSKVVDGANDHSAALAAHKRWTSASVSHLLATIHEGR